MTLPLSSSASARLHYSFGYNRRIRLQFTMSNILKLSTRPADLLHEVEGSRATAGDAPKSTLFSGNLAAKKTSDTPAAAFRQPVHELQTDANRRIDLAGVVGERRAVGGTAQAEQLINELYSASQINRGPAGFCPPSRLHLDMLLGRDEAIGYSDYLNFSEHQV